MMRSSGSRGTARAGTRRIDGLAVSHGSADAREYEGATSTTSCPSATRSRRKVSIDVETPLTRGKKRSEILRMRMSNARAKLIHLCKRVSSHVFGLCRGGHDIVFDSNAAKGLELIDHSPVDMGASRIGVRSGQQGIDQIYTRFHRHDHA